ncbi:MAG TPA: FAD-dependent oxidoreductase, partial [Planctomycetota bacterium]|nr:FAD-dependent oxidoreductase [Planctomycetota bacterium]
MASSANDEDRVDERDAGESDRLALTPDRTVVVVGGGIVGLSIARELARRGLRVVVVEADRCGAGASSRAIGVLSPIHPKQQSTLKRFLRSGYEAWPDFARELRDETAIDIGYRACGSVVLLPGALAREDEVLGEWRGAGISADLLDRSAIARWIPSYGGPFSHGVRIEAGAIVHPPSVIAALVRAVRKLGVRIIEGTGPVTLALWPWGGARLVFAEGSIFPESLDGIDPYSAAIVVAAGAWSTDCTRELPEPRPKVSPVRGQVI